MKLADPKLVELLQLAYSAERAAALAYVGHARSVRDPAQKEAIRQIESDEWGHREAVLQIMQRHDVPVSPYKEWKYWVIGKLIGFSCHLIGWFMPYYFAGRLESGNVCEYFLMMWRFDRLGITEHDEVLYEMGMKEKEHEEYFQASLQNNRLLPIFERIFGWGNRHSFNDVDMQQRRDITAAKDYCPDRHR